VTLASRFIDELDPWKLVDLDYGTAHVGAVILRAHAAHLTGSLSAGDLLKVESAAHKAALALGVRDVPGMLASARAGAQGMSHRDRLSFAKPPARA
jgi:hypothetical protein